MDETQPFMPYQPQPRRSRRRSRRVGELTAISLLSAALASGGTWGALTLASDDEAATGGSGTTSTSSSSSDSADAVPVSAAAKKAPDWNAVTEEVAPSVVAIGVQGQTAGGEGSGVVLDEEGHVVTNNHVVSGAGEDARNT